LFPLALVIAIPTGCAWFRPKSSYDRDPLVQSHLLGKKNRTAGLAKGDAGRGDSVLQPTGSSTSNKPAYPNPYRGAVDPDGDRLPGRLPGEQAQFGHDPDFRWIIGRIERLPERGADFYVRYAEPDSADRNDRFGGRLRLAFSPRLAMIREGDIVKLEGRLLDTIGKEPGYQVGSFAILQP
jgi:hypothetical protein